MKIKEQMSFRFEIVAGQPAPGWLLPTCLLLCLALSILQLNECCNCLKQLAQRYSMAVFAISEWCKLLVAAALPHACALPLAAFLTIF
jgi:hypothetical protein